MLASPAGLTWQALTLRLHTPFRVSYGASATRRAFWLRLAGDAGWGEGTIPPYYGIETSLGATAMAHLAGLADWLDLDAPLLLANDPFRGIWFDQEAGVHLPEGAGIGVKLRDCHCWSLDCSTNGDQRCRRSDNRLTRKSLRTILSTV